MAYIIDKKATEMQKRCINEAIKVVTDLDIPVSKNIEFIFWRLASNHGYCRTLSKDKYLIKIHKDIVDEYELICTIIHEILHTVENKKYTWHRGYWLKYAKYVSERTKYIIRCCVHLELNEKWELGLSELTHEDRSNYIANWLKKISKDSSLLKKDELNEIMNFASDSEIYTILHTLFTMEWDWGDMHHKCGALENISSFLCRDVDCEIRKRICKEYLNDEYLIPKRTAYEIWRFEAMFSLTNEFRPVIEHSEKVLGKYYLDRVSGEMWGYRALGFDVVCLDKTRSGLPADILFDSRGKDRKGTDGKIRVYIFNVNDEHIENWEKELLAIDISDGNAHFSSRYDGDLSAEQQRQVLDFVTQYAAVLARHYNREIDSFTALNMMSI